MYKTLRNENKIEISLHVEVKKEWSVTLMKDSGDMDSASKCSLMTQMPQNREVYANDALRLCCYMVQYAAQTMQDTRSAP